MRFNRLLKYKELLMLTVLVLIALVPRIIAASSQGWLAEDVFFIDSINTWFLDHFTEYFFQFQHTHFPPRSPEFGTPPLGLWLETFGMYLGEKYGLDFLISARSVNVFFGILTIIVIYFFGKRWFNQTTGIVASFAVALTPTIIAIDASAHVDTILAFFIIVDIYVFFRYIENREDSTFVFLAFLLGLSLLVKIYASVIVLLIVVYLLMEKNVQKIKLRTIISFLVIIALVITSLWAGARDFDHISRTIFRMKAVGSLSSGVGYGGMFDEYSNVEGYTDKSIYYNFLMLFGRSLPLVSITFFFFIIPLSIYRILIYFKHRRVQTITIRMLFILSIIFAGILAIYFFGGPNAVANRIIYIMVLESLLSGYAISLILKRLTEKYLRNTISGYISPRFFTTLFIILIISANFIPLLYWNPKFYNAYNNFLVGGVEGGSKLYRVGHGEGLEIAGQWIMNNTDENTILCAPRINFINKYVTNRTFAYCPLNKNLDYFISQGSDYLILHNSFMSGGLRPPILNDIEYFKLKPSFVVIVDNYPYIVIYKVPKIYERTTNVDLNASFWEIGAKTQYGGIQVSESYPNLNYRYNISAGDWVFIRKDISIPSQEKGITISLLGDGRNETFYLDLGKRNVGYLRYIKKIDWIGWQNYSISFNSMESKFEKINLNDIDYIKLSVDSSNKLESALSIKDIYFIKKKNIIISQEMNTEIARPVTLYSTVSRFWFNETTGDLDITIEYEPQRWFYIGAAISLTTLILSILYLIYDWQKNRRKKEPYKSGTNWKTEQKPLEMPKIVTKTVGAINDRSRLIIKRRSNPELKALHHHVVHKGYHYKQKPTLSEYIKKKIEELKGRFLHKRK